MTNGHEPADLTAALAELAGQWQGLLAEHDRLLVVGSAEGLGPLGLSDAALRQALDVLVANSVEHGAGTITVTASDSGRTVSIEVSDEGPGIAGDPELAFARRADGTTNHGIGLALARTLVEAEGGRLEYLAAPRPRFSLMVPADAD
jgi:signal transduction histidine kinase